MTATIKQHKNFIPIIFLTGLCIWTVYEVLFTKVEIEGELYDRSFSRTNILAFIAVALNIVIYNFARKYYKYSVIITVVLGLIGVLNYTANTYTATFIIPFQPISLLVGLLYLAINYKRVKAKLERSSEQNLEVVANLEKVEDFKSKYRHKTTEELMEISNDSRFVTEAKIASNELILQRTREAQQLT